MTAGIQRTGLNESAYERPQQNWVCGWASEGKPCRHGPNAKGRCVATFECTPSISNGRWQCTRQSVHGGRCEDGPRPDGTCCRAIAPCQPVLSWRARRGKLTKWTLALTLGLLIVSIVWMGPSAVSPGPLSAKHSTAAQGCGSCHFSGHETFSGWLGVALGTISKVGESTRCTECHDRGEHPLAAHSVSPDLLSSWSRLAQMKPHKATVPIRLNLSNLTLRASELRDRELPCTTCHLEHRGQTVDLIQMTNIQCQGCHSNRFQSFEQGHPEFDNFPYERRTRIRFNHANHLNKHFSKKQRKVFDCNSCHQPHAAGRQMLVRSFEQSCGECHEKQIVSDTQPVFVIPAFDLESLEDREVDIGAWPEEGFEGIAPMIRLMLSGHPELRDALTLLDEIEDLEDLSDEDEVTDEHLEAVATVAWGIKSLLADLARSGHDGMAWYLKASLGEDLPNKALAELSGGLPQHTLLEMIDIWFPELEDELENYQAGVVVPTTAIALGNLPKRNPFSADNRSLYPDSALSDWAFVKTSGSQQINYLQNFFDQPPGDPHEALLEDPPEEVDAHEDWPSGGGWYHSEDDYGLYYRISDHQDTFLRAWLDIAAQFASVDANALEMLASNEAPGRCIKCHSIDRDTDSGLLNVKWTPFRATKTRLVTQFSHEAHFSLGDQNGCLTCHKPSNSSQFAEGFEDYDPNTFSSNFQAMTIDTCRQCHNAERAGSNCMTCHNYHVGDFKPTLLTVKSLTD